MKRRIRFGWLCLAVLALVCVQIRAAGPQPLSEPPKDYVWPVEKLTRYTPTAEEVLKAPEGVAGDFDVAQAPPVIDFAIVPGQWEGAKLWSNWGNSLYYAADGNFYCSIGDHMGPHGNSYVYKIDLAQKAMQMVVDYSKVVGVPVEQYTPGKIHGPLMDGGDGWIYFIGYQGSGGTDDAHGYKGDWMLRYEVATGKVENLGFPVPFCGAPASILHLPSRTIYGLGSQGANSSYDHSPFFVYDLAAGKLKFVDGIAPNLSRAVLLADDGRVYYSTGKNPPAPKKTPPPKTAKGKATTKPQAGASAEVAADKPPASAPAKPSVPHPMVRYDPKTNQVELTKALLPGDGTLRAASRPDSKGVAYGITSSGDIFAFDTKTETIREITQTFVVGPPYTAICLLSPDERYLYYIPSAHGKSCEHGTAVLQLDVRTGRRKVLAFLNDYIRKQQNGYNLGGTFGIALSQDGSMLHACFNGAPAGSKSPDFGLCSAVVLHIPESERTPAK